MSEGRSIKPKCRLNRRDFLGGAVLASSSVVLAGAAEVDPNNVWKPGEADAPQPALGSDYRFFNEAEAAFMAALVNHLIPPDELGPGAHEAGVTFFLDRQLDGSFGRADSWYMQGPWAEGADGQGYQSRLTPAAFYRTAIAAIDAHCMQQYGKAFTALDHDTQEGVVGELEAGKVELNGAPQDGFFDMLMQNVIEGYFSDPIYGGNRDMAGWRMIGFPGAYYNYRRFLPARDRLEIEPVGLAGGPAWRAHK
jgi:gluconate 2-dehydrogenase gamma chain